MCNYTTKKPNKEGGCEGEGEGVIYHTHLKSIFSCILSRHFTKVLCVTIFSILGEYDCADWSDEIITKANSDCPYAPLALTCDEHICKKFDWACGDGECFSLINRLGFQKLISKTKSCASMREFAHACETTIHMQLWTQSNGLCWPFPGYDDETQPNPAGSVIDICRYYVRCALTGGFETDCQCNSSVACSNLVQLACKTRSFIPYPERGLIRPFILLAYTIMRSDWEIKLPDHILLAGQFKCRGFSVDIRNVFYSIPFDVNFMHAWVFDSYFCGREELPKNNSSAAPQYDRNCWWNEHTFNNQPYAFVDVCRSSGECISTYRIHDGALDCNDMSDERDTVLQNTCQNILRYRFRCSFEEHKCLTVHRLSDSENECDNGADEIDWEMGILSRRNFCRERNDIGCQQIRMLLIRSWYSNKTSMLMSRLFFVRYGHALLTSTNVCQGNV